MEQNKLKLLYEQIKSLSDELNKKLDLFDEQVCELIYQKSQIDASIQYASRIQFAMLPNIKILNKNIGQYFILYKPRDIVSGDFYWMTHKEGKTIIVAADCTGHGVPGAFISMIGVNLLNQIVNTERILRPDKILNKLRLNIVKSLQQKGLPGGSKDGMDLALISIDTEKNELQFAGANNPVYIVRKGKLIETKGNNMSISINNQMDPFTKTFYDNTKLGKDFLLKQDKLYPFANHTFDMQPGDNIYIFSDGYADQFGGDKNKKFLIKNFKSLLMEINAEKMDIQKKKLNSTIEEWKGDQEQIDDILVIGIKI